MIMAVSPGLLSDKKFVECMVHQEGVPLYFGIMQAVLRVIINPENEPVPWQGV